MAPAVTGQPAQLSEHVMAAVIVPIVEEVERLEVGGFGRGIVAANRVELGDFGFDKHQRLDSFVAEWRTDTPGGLECTLEKFERFLGATDAVVVRTQPTPNSECVVRSQSLDVLSIDRLQRPDPRVVVAALERGATEFKDNVESPSDASTELESSRKDLTRAIVRPVAGSPRYVVGLTKSARTPPTRDICAMLESDAFDDQTCAYCARGTRGNCVSGLRLA